MRVLFFLTGAMAGVLSMNGVAFAATQNSESSPAGLLFVVGLILTLWGLYRSKKERIVVFANLTDVLVTLAVPILMVIMLFVGRFMQLSDTAMASALWGIGCVGFFFIAKATKAYNKSVGVGFFSFLHALLTKIFIVVVYVAAMFLIFTYGGASRRKHERESTRIRRSHRYRAVGYGVSSFIFTILTLLGLWEMNFVSFGDYMNGIWNDESDAEEDEEYETEEEA